MKDKSNMLDHLIREKLEGLGAPYRPETWDWLSERLDAEEAAVDPLDDIVRNKLADLATPYRPETWDWMSERLDTEEAAVDPLDDIVRNRLTNLAAPYRPETWDWMSERLEDLEEGAPAGAEMQPMDEAVYDRMHRLEKPYDPNHWPLLLKKLEANAFVGERIIRYKAMELSLLVLLLITFIRLPFFNGSAEPIPPASRESRPQAHREIAPREEAPTAAVSVDQHPATTGTNTTAALAERTPAFPPDGDVRPDATASRREAPKATADTPTPKKMELAALPAPGRVLAAPDLRLPLPYQPAQDHFQTEAPVLAVRPNQMLGSTAYLPTGIVRPICLSCSGQLDQKVLAPRQNTFFRIGMQGGPDFNRVITPPTRIGGQYHEADRYSLGYSGGLTLGLEKGRWEIETGLIYSNKRYYALPVLVLDGSVEDGFVGDGTKQFDLDIFQVPLNFRYNFIRKNRWRVYAMGGMSLHLTTQSNYYLAEADGFTTSGFQPQPFIRRRQNQGRNAPSIKSEFDNFTKGWLEGGSFSENGYLSANAGLGVERFITDYWSIYAQPTFSQSLIYLNDGLGPYYDRIHTNSLIFGVKVRLK